MPAKFKVGDRVKIINDEDFICDKEDVKIYTEAGYLGSIGTVIEIGDDERNEYPYEVRLSKMAAEAAGERIRPFNDREIIRDLNGLEKALKYAKELI